MANVSDWNFFNRAVQSGLLEGRYLNAAYTLIAAGPPRLAALVSPSASDIDLGNIAWPIGILQNLGLGQNSQILRLWEIGSERSYFIRGRTAGQIGLGRVLYHGPSMLRGLYAYMKAERGSVRFEQLYPNDANVLLNTSGAENSKREFAVAPGYENFWIDLASDVFSQPIGLLFLMRDSNGDTYGAFYAEAVMVANHNLQTDSGGTVYSESTSLLYERLIPIDVKAVPLIKDSTDIQSIVGSNVVGIAS